MQNPNSLEYLVSNIDILNKIKIFYCKNNFIQRFTKYNNYYSVITHKILCCLYTD